MTNIDKTSGNNDTISYSKSPKKKIKHNCFFNTEINLTSDTPLENTIMNSIPLSNKRSKSEGRRKKIEKMSEFNSKRNLIIETEASLSSKNNTIKSKRDKRLEYESKIKSVRESNIKDKSTEKKTNSNPPIIKANKTKELSIDSLNEDRPKRSAPDNSVKKNSVVMTISNVIPTSPVLDSIPSLISENNSEFKEKNEKKAEMVQKLIVATNSVKLKDLEKEKERERNKKLEKVQKKLTLLSSLGRLGFIENEENLTTNENMNSEENKIEDQLAFTKKNVINDNEIIESSKENLKSNDPSDSPLKTSKTNSKKNLNINTSSNNYLNKVMEYSKSISSSTRKPKVDTFEYFKKILPNMKKNDVDNLFRKSFSKENSRLEDINFQSLECEPKYSLKIEVKNNDKEKQENEAMRKKLIVEQKKKRKDDKFKEERKIEEKAIKTFLGLKRLEDELKSKSLEKTNSKQRVKNTSSYAFRAKEDSSILESGRYYNEVIEFINDFPTDANNNFKTKEKLPIMRFNSVKNATSHKSSKNSFRNSLNNENESKKEGSQINRNFSSNSNSVKKEKEVKLIKLNSITSNENQSKNKLQIMTSPKSIEFNSLYNPLSTPEEEKIVEKPVTHYKFQKFLEDKIKNTVRSMDSNEFQISKVSPLNNVINSPQINIPVTNISNNSVKLNNVYHNNINEFNQKNLVGDEKMKINELKKMYDICIERFKNMPENSIVSNLSGNMSFKKNLQILPPESKNIELINTKHNNDIIIEQEDQEIITEMIAAQKIQNFIRKSNSNISKESSKKLVSINEENKPSERISLKNSPGNYNNNCLISEEDNYPSLNSSKYSQINELVNKSNHSESERLSLSQANRLNYTQQDNNNRKLVLRPNHFKKNHYSADSQINDMDCWENKQDSIQENSEIKSNLSHLVDEKINISNDNILTLSKNDKSIVFELNNNESMNKSRASNNISRASDSRKCYSFFNAPSNNTIILCPNSFDSPKLHRIRLLVEKQRGESSNNSIVNQSEDNKKSQDNVNKSGNENISNFRNEDSLDSNREILWQNNKNINVNNKITINHSNSEEESSENKVLNYSHLSNIDYQETSDNKLKYAIPEESNENDSQVNKIFQSVDSEKKTQEQHINEEVLLLNGVFKESGEAVLGEKCPENNILKKNDEQIYVEIIDDKLNLSDNYLNKETTFNRFERFQKFNLPENVLKDNNSEAFQSHEEVKDTNNSLKLNHSNTTTEKPRFGDIEADKDDSNIDWQLTLNSEISSRSNVNELLPNTNSQTLNRYDSQKKNSLNEIKEEEENSKNYTRNDKNETHKDEESYSKEEFFDNFETSNNDIVSEILIDNEIVKDIKIKQNDETNNKDLGVKSRNNNLSNDKNIEINPDNIVESNKIIETLKSENKDDSSLRLPNNFTEEDQLFTDENIFKSSLPAVQEGNKENNRYPEEDVNKDINNPQNIDAHAPKTTDDEYIKNLDENELERLITEISEKLFEESIMKELRERIIPLKNNKQNNNNLSISISLPTEVQNSACIKYFNTKVLDNNTIPQIIIKSLVDDRNDINYNIYSTQIGPKLVNKISQGITENFSNIIKNLSTPYFSKPKEIIQSIIFKDKQRLQNSHKQVNPLGDPNNIPLELNVKRIQEEFTEENKKIREFGKNFLEYDEILNDCILESAVELLKKQRMYGTQGEPLPWSSRTRVLKYKFSETNSKSNEKFTKKIQNELHNVLNEKLGILPENIELELEYLNAERDKRVIAGISKETATENEDNWKNYEVEETQVKLELSEMVLEQLLNEVVEILEHVHLSRKNPNLYQHKSIYACEEIPRLSFQVNNNNENVDEVNQ